MQYWGGKLVDLHFPFKTSKELTHSVWLFMIYGDTLWLAC